MGNLFCKKKAPEELYENSFFSKSELILNTTNLSDSQKILFRRRYMNKLYSLRYFKQLYSIWFYTHKFLSTTLGVAIPALLSIQYFYSDNSVNNPIYWTAWVMSIIGGFATGYNNVFKVDQRYFLLRTIYQRMKNEGWSFIILCNRYDQKDCNNQKIKHDVLFIVFMQSVEQIIDDYSKNDMETVMEDSNKKDEQMEMILERALSNSNPKEQLPILDPPSLNTIGVHNGIAIHKYSENNANSKSTTPMPR